MTLADVLGPSVGIFAEREHPPFCVLRYSVYSIFKKIHKCAGIVVARLGRIMSIYVCTRSLAL